MVLAFAENSIQLVPDGTIFIHIVLIILMVYVLNATLFRPINRVLEDRERRTRGRSSEAQEILRQVDAKLSQYEQTIRGARVEGYQLLEQQRAEALRERQNRLNSLREELGSATEEQTRSIQTQMEQARMVLGEEARRVASDIGRQILHRSI